MCCVCVCVGHDSSHLDAALNYYDTLHTSQLRLQSHPLPGVRGVSFHALGKDFRLQLRPDRRTLTSDFRVYSVNSRGHRQAHDVESDNFLYGHIRGLYLLTHTWASRVCEHCNLQRYGL